MDLLDDVKIIEKKKPIFSLLSILMITAFLCMLYHIGSTIESNTDINNEETLFIITISLFVLGMVFSLMAIVRKEKPMILRLISVGVILIFLIALAVAIFMDI